MIEESVKFILEDPEGHATRVYLYNYPRSVTSEQDIKAIFKEGSIWVIREPSYKRINWEDFTNPIVSVDSPSDIVPVTSTDRLMRDIQWSGGPTPSLPRSLSSIEEYRLKGACEFKAQNWLYAAICYTNGLELDKDSVIMRLNRSEAYIRLGWYNSALCDADHAINVGIEDVQLYRKAIYRATRACYYGKDYERAIAYAEKLSDDADAANWVTRARERLYEQRTGDYDWCTLYRETLTKCPRPDAADYVGPIEVKAVDPLRGRGLYATRDIEIGELLVR